VPDAQGDVLPATIGGQKSASKYMSRVFSGLRANITDESTNKAVETLSMLLKLWQKQNAQKALSIVRKCKISWSSVLFRAAPTETIKGKKNKPEQKVIRSPSKPSRSPWLSPAERAELGNILKDDWSFLEIFREKWTLLQPEEQHDQFINYIKQIKAKYSELKTLSDSIHAKLGKRKYWIERVCKADNFKAKPKKGESEAFLMSKHFFTKDLSTTAFGVKKIFSPLTFLTQDKWMSVELWGNLTHLKDGEDILRLSSADFSSERAGPAYGLWRIWADTFRPVIRRDSRIEEEAPQLETFNIFSKLPVVDGS
jgi:hypothetical protein